MITLYGLGNPGKQYTYTRHNVGALWAQWVSRQNTGWTIIEPQNYMNESGNTIKKYVYNIVNRGLLVAHDDLDIPFGKHRLVYGYGPKLHGGILSIERTFGTTGFWRLRIGVDHRGGVRIVSGEKYVLQPFTPEELHVLHDTIFPALWHTIQMQQSLGWDPPYQ